MLCSLRVLHYVKFVIDRSRKWKINQTALTDLVNVLGHFPQPLHVFLNDGEIFVLHFFFAIADLDPNTHGAWCSSGGQYIKGGMVGGSDKTFNILLFRPLPDCTQNEQHTCAKRTTLDIRRDIGCAKRLKAKSESYDQQ